MLTDLVTKLKLLEYFPADLFGGSLVVRKYFRASVVGCLPWGRALGAILEPHWHL